MNLLHLILFFSVDAIIVFFIVGGAIGGAWKPLSQLYPAQPVGDGAFRKNFQSIAIGSVGVGLSVHMAADDNYLHWIPAKLLRIVGCKAVSIPWPSILPSPKQPRVQKSMAYIHLKELNKPLTVPHWCIEIKNTVEPR